MRIYAYGSYMTFQDCFWRSDHVEMIGRLYIITAFCEKYCHDWRILVDVEHIMPVNWNIMNEKLEFAFKSRHPDAVFNHL